MERVHKRKLLLDWTVEAKVKDLLPSLQTAQKMKGLRQRSEMEPSGHEEPPGRLDPMMKLSLCLTRRTTEAQGSRAPAEVHIKPELQGDVEPVLGARPDDGSDYSQIVCVYIIGSKF